MSDRGLAPGTVRRAFNVVNGILQKAYKWGIVPENVARRCELPKLTQKDIEFWDAEQASTLLEALNLTYHQKCKGHTRVLASTGEPYTVPEYERAYTIDRVWKEFFSLELHTGMRRGELCGLRWCDVDFENCTVSVNQVLARLILESQSTRIQSETSFTRLSRHTTKNMAAISRTSISMAPDIHRLLF